MGQCRLLAIDIDGTLVAGTESCSERNRAAIGRAVAAGVAVVFVTARPWQTTAPLADACSLDGTALCSLGAIAYDLSNRQVTEVHPLPMPVVAEAVEHLREESPGVTFGWVTPSSLNVEPAYPTAGDIWSRTGIDALLNTAEPVAHLFARCRDRSSDSMDSTVASLAGLVECAPWSSGVLDLTAPGVSKAAALAGYCQERHIDQTRVVAVGDAAVDVPMIRWAEIGIAVGNASPEVRAAADLVVAPCVDDGVADAIDAVLSDPR